MLLGRGPERAAIDGLIRGASQGVSGVLLLSGDAGAGKTALLEYAADTTAGMTVVRARGIEAESSLPFAALADVLRPMMAQLDRLPPVQSASLRAALVIGPPLPGDRFTTYVGALNLMALFAETQPLLVVVDDLHWIDPESGEALFFAARRLGAERIAMLFAARDSRELPADPAALPVLHLDGLDKDPSLQLLSHATPAIAAPVATAAPPSMRHQCRCSTSRRAARSSGTVTSTCEIDVPSAAPSSESRGMSRKFAAMFSIATTPMIAVISRCRWRATSSRPARYATG